MAVDPQALAEDFTSRVGRLIQQVHDSRPMDGVTEVLVPGELEMRSRARSLQDGVVTLSASTYRKLRMYAREAGLKSEL